MKRENVNYFVVGVFVLAMIGAFLVLMYFVTGRTGPSDNYIVRYKNVTGLKFGTGVFYEGYHVGQVEKITPAPAATGMEYILTLSILSGWKIPTDSVARIVASGLISAVQIEIEEGTNVETIVPGGEIPGREQGNLFAALNQAAGQFESLSQEGLMPVLDNLNHRINEVADEILAFRRDQLTPLVVTLNQRLNEDLFGGARTLLAQLNSSAAQLEKMLGAGNQRQLTDFLQHIDEAAVNLNALISRIETTRLQMDETLVTLGDLVTRNDDEVAEAVRNASISMQQMRAALTLVNEHIAAIMYNADGSTRQLHEFSRAIRDNPSRLIRGSEPGEEP